MAVTFDSFANGGQFNGTGGWTHPSITGSVLWVAVGGYYPAVGTSSVTSIVTVGTGANFKNLTLFAQLNNENTAGAGWTQLWYIQNPPQGSQPISVSQFSGSTGLYAECCSISYKGVTQVGTPVINYGTATPASSGSVASAVGSMVLNVVGGAAATFSALSGTPRYNPAGAFGYTTLAVQDRAGAATVSQTATFSGSFGWGSIAANMVGGTARTGNASMAGTMTASARASFVGQVLGQRAFQTMTMTARAGGVATHLGPPLRYVGRYPDTDSTVIPVAYATADNASVAVTPGWVTQAVNSAAANCVDQAWVLGQVATRQTQTQLTTALASYIPKSALGATSGVARSDTNNLIPSGQLPTLTTNSLAQCYDVNGSYGHILVGPTSTVTSVTQNINEIIIAQISVPDPGYPWIPLPFAYVRAAAGGVSTLLTSGTGNVGCLTVVIEGKPTTYYGVGVCTDDINPNYYPVVPYGIPANTQNAVAGAQTPVTQPPLPATTASGQTTFQLGACNLPGVPNSNNYLFSGASLIYYILVVPAVHS